MRSPHSFIVTPLNEKRYDNVKKIGDIDFVTSLSVEDHKSSNRLAEVMSTPIGYEGQIKKGDILLVHHNVFKFYYSMSGKQSSGKSHLFDNVFSIDPEQYFMIYNGSEWICDGKSSFVRPVKCEDSTFKKGLKNEPLKVEMVYSSPYMESKGITPGTIVGFHPDSEYEFEVDGEKLYRIYDSMISINYGRGNDT